MTHCFSINGSQINVNNIEELVTVVGGTTDRISDYANGDGISDYANGDGISDYVPSSFPRPVVPSSFPRPVVPSSFPRPFITTGFPESTYVKAFSHISRMNDIVECVGNNIKKKKVQFYFKNPIMVNDVIAAIRFTFIENLGIDLGDDYIIIPELTYTFICFPNYYIEQLCSGMDYLMDTIMEKLGVEKELDKRRRMYGMDYVIMPRVRDIRAIVQFVPDNCKRLM